MDATPSSADYSVVELVTNFGSVFIELYPDTAPGTVENFLGYVERDDYDGSFFHRMIVGNPADRSDDFVLQGGGFRYDREGEFFIPPNVTIPQGIRGFSAIEGPEIDNEFERTNAQWTLAMAKRGDDPDSATSQFFINLNDNAENLDNQNGGFTVFAAVIAGFEVVEAIIAQPVQNLGGSGLFAETPVTDNFNPSTATDILAEDLVTIIDAKVLYSSGTGLTPSGSATIGGAAGPTGAATFTVPNADAGLLAFQQTSSGWTVSELGLKTNALLSTAQSVTFVNPADGATQTFTTSSGSSLLFTPDASGGYTSRNLLLEIADAEALTSSLTTFTSIDGLVYVAGLTAGGDIGIYAQTGTSGASGAVWRFENLSDTMRNQGLTPPTFAGALTSYVTTWNGLNIAGLDANGDIQTVWFAPGLESWTTSNLSDLTGAPALTGGLKPYLTSWGGINLAGADSTGDLTTTWWVPGGAWQNFNFTESLSGPQLTPESTATYVTSWDGLNIVGLDGDGNLTVYWWAPGLDVWQVTNLGEVVEGDTPPAGPVTGVTSSAGQTSIAGVTDAGDLVRYTWSPTTPWTFENISEAAQFE